MKRFIPLIVALGISACTTGPMTEVPTRHTPVRQMLPDMKVFTAAPERRKIGRSNAEIAQDFLDLSFEMESGRIIENMTRYEGPITLALAQDSPAYVVHDLKLLVQRLRTEAQIDISIAPVGTEANIVVATLPRQTLRISVPHAACFVVPRVKNWQEFRRNRRSGALDWTTLTQRERATIFIPADVAPQELRDCLHEEIAQALGPLNDIYRLGDSVFNDDNIHTVLTAFDMLVLRLYYSDALKNGMTRAQAASVLPRLLSRFNPAGDAIAANPTPEISRDWIRAIELAVGPRTSDFRRISEAAKALEIATRQGWTDNRVGFSLFVLGRMAIAQDPELAASSFSGALGAYTQLYGPHDIHTAHVVAQMAAFALSAGRPDAAVRVINTSLPAAHRAQNASLLATLLLVKAESLDALGKEQEAAAVRADGLGWARYGFGTDREVFARYNEIAALRPPSLRSES